MNYCFYCQECTTFPSITQSVCDQISAFWDQLKHDTGWHMLISSMLEVDILNT